MAIERHCRLAAASAIALGGFASAASAQYAGDPFFDTTVEQSRAFTLEMIGAKLKLAGIFAPPFDEELAERFEAMPTVDWARFGGTLAEADTALAVEFREALEAVAEAAEEGEPTAAPAGEAWESWARAYAAVVPGELRESPAFVGALLIDLLLAEGGVAEGYEEAVENVWEYPGGWAALGRVDELWETIRPQASEQQHADAREMLAQIHALYPDAGPPDEDEVVTWNPEEAEAPAQRLGGILEGITDANLYPGRDPGRLLGHLAGLTGGACDLYDAGRDEVAAETIAAVLALFDANLAGMMSVFAPEAGERAEEQFGALVVIGEDEDDEAEEEEEGEDEPAAEAGADAGPTCRDLATTLLEMRGVLGG